MYLITYSKIVFSSMSWHHIHIVPFIRQHMMLLLRLVEL